MHNGTSKKELGKAAIFGLLCGIVGILLLSGCVRAHAKKTTPDGVIYEIGYTRVGEQKFDKVTLKPETGEIIIEGQESNLPVVRLSGVTIEGVGRRGTVEEVAE